MSTYNFNDTIDTWIAALEQYSFTRLCTKPSSGSWSLGQLYMHLVADTHYYTSQIKICLGSNDNIIEEASPAAREMLDNNSFPDEILKGAPGNAFIPQPASKELLREDLNHIKDEMNALKILVSESPFRGKTKHPGFNYFNAKEWLQFADMHFRHHLRQKQRIDRFLINENTQ